MIPVFHSFYPMDSSYRVLRPATFRERLMAQLTDGIILGIICSAILFVLSEGDIFAVWIAPIFPQFLLQVKEGLLSQAADWWWGGHFLSLTLPYGKLIYFAYPAPLLVAIYVAYYSFYHYKTGQTPGKMLKRLVVLGENGAKIPLSKAFIRYLVYWVALLPLGAGFWWGAWRKDFRSLPDFLTHTGVYYFEV